MGISYPPQLQTYSSLPPEPGPPIGTPGGYAHGTSSNAALSFGAPGQDLQTGPTPSPGQGGKYGPDPNFAPNQIGTGTAAPTQPNYDPTLGMNQSYAPWNQLPGTMTSGAAPDFGQSVTQPVALSGGMPNLTDLLGGVTSNPSTATSSGFGISPYFLGPYSYLGAESSPFGISPYWSSPFLTNSGKAMT